MTYPTVPLNYRVRISPSPIDPTADPSTFTWVDITSFVLPLSDLTDDIGGTDDSTEPSTSFTATLINNDGRFTTDNAESPYYPYFDIGCPIEYAIDAGAGMVVQTITYLGKAENDWTSNTEYRCLANIQAGGQFQRLGLKPAIASPVKRTLLSRRRKGVWMLEDAAGATSAASELPVQGPMTALTGSPPEFGQSALVTGIASMARFSAGQNLTATLNTPTTSPGVRISFLFHAATIPGGQVELVSLPTVTGTAIARYVLEMGPGQLRFRAYTATGAEVSAGAALGFTAHQTDCVWLDLDIVQTSAGTITWTVRETTWRYNPDGTPLGSSGTLSNTFSGTLGSIRAVSISPQLTVDDVYVGAINLNEQPFGISGGSAAVLSWAGNKATERVSGMCGEFRVPYHVTATNLGSALGPQLNDSLMANLINVWQTDHGVLTDHLGVVDYRALSELYNLAPAITLTRAVRGQLGELHPVRDDTAVVNIASAHRTGGSTATATNVEDVLRRGPYEREAIEVNVLTDAALPGHAGWALARGTATDQRYDELTIRMHVAAGTTPALPAQVLALKLGDRIAVSSLPRQAGKPGREWQVRGRRQVVRNRRIWDITYKLVPVDPYNAYALDVTRLDANGAELIQIPSPADTGTVFVAIMPEVTATVGGPALGIPLLVSGERVTLNTVADESYTDGFVRTTSGGLGNWPATANTGARAWFCSTSGGTLADFATTGAEARMTLSVAAGLWVMSLPSLPLRSHDMTGFASYAVVPTGADLELQLDYRWNGPSVTGYSARVVLQPAGTVRLALYPPGSAAPIADIPLPLTHTAGALYGIRVLCVGTRHKVKVWQGATEPIGVDTWALDVRDDTRITAGYMRWRAGKASGNTNASPVATWHRVWINNVQAFTVVRSVNGVVKSQAANNPVHVYNARGLGV